HKGRARYVPARGNPCRPEKKRLPASPRYRRSYCAAAKVLLIRRAHENHTRLLRIRRVPLIFYFKYLFGDGYFGWVTGVLPAFVRELDHIRPFAIFRLRFYHLQNDI